MKIEIFPNFLLLTLFLKDPVECNLLSLPVSPTSTQSSRPLTEEVAVDDKLSNLGGKLKSAAARGGAEADCISEDYHHDFDNVDDDSLMLTLY